MRGVDDVDVDGLLALEDDAVRARARAMTRGDGGAREGHGSNRNVVTYSPKVFVPVTKTCRDSCGYCAFVEAP